MTEEAKAAKREYLRDYQKEWRKKNRTKQGISRALLVKKGTKSHKRAGGINNE